MHFDKGQTPPVDGFWSLTMYNAEYFFVDNKLNKYTVSPRNASSTTLTARSTFTFRMNRQARIRSPTGCRHPKTNSF